MFPVLAISWTLFDMTPNFFLKWAKSTEPDNLFLPSEPVLIHACDDMRKEILLPNSQKCEILSYRREVNRLHENIPKVRDTRDKILDVIGEFSLSLKTLRAGPNAQE